MKLSSICRELLALQLAPSCDACLPSCVQGTVSVEQTMVGPTSSKMMQPIFTLDACSAPLDQTMCAWPPRCSKVVLKCTALYACSLAHDLGLSTRYGTAPDALQLECFILCHIPRGEDRWRTICV
eukprot:590913-Amphidinium_carterae.1